MSVKEAVYTADIIFTYVGDDAAITAIVESCLKSSVRNKFFVDYPSRYVEYG